MPPRDYEDALRRIRRMIAARISLAGTTPELAGMADAIIEAGAEITAAEIARVSDWVEFEVEIQNSIGGEKMNLSQVTVDWNSVAPDKHSERAKPLVTIIAPADRAGLDRSLARVHPEHPFRKGLPGIGSAEP